MRIIHIHIHTRLIDTCLVAFDGAMIVAALWILIILHPGWLLVDSEAHSVALRPKYQEGSSYDANNSNYSMSPLKPAV